MSVVLALALASGGLLSWFSVSHTLRVEKEARDRYNETLRTRDELERLSARLQDAQEQERRSLSRELHDEIGQSLTFAPEHAQFASLRVKPIHVGVTVG